MPKTVTRFTFQTTLLRPAKPESDTPWTFLRLPQDASDKLPARSMVSVEGTFNDHPFQATLNPDGEGGHWLKVKPELSTAAKANPGDTVTLEIAPVKVEPEPEIPEDLQAALDATPPAQEAWNSTTAIARRDWIQWMTTGKKAETRPLRIEKAMDMLSKGKKRVCCFDRTGMYDKSQSCPVAAPITD